MDIKEKIRIFITDNLAQLTDAINDLPAVEIEKPADPSHGDFSTNIALKSARVFRKKPADIALDIIQQLQKSLESSDLKSYIASIEVKGPGFINFRLSSDAVYEVLHKVFKEKDNFGTSNFGKDEKIQIEFVSANPTGPLSVAHARQAAVGDALVNIFTFIGFDAHKEYYINDGGNQIRILGLSIKTRALQSVGVSVEFPEDAYQGDYIKDMAQIFMDQEGLKTEADIEGVDLSAYSKFGADYLLNVIKTDLKDFGVEFDCWSHESKIATKENIEKLLTDMDKQGLTYESEGALWFKTTDFGDDKDRVLRKT
ncbi:MAG: arginyl-tRNA synthetase, partial [Candidatus Omnitrophota bacterium]